MEMESDVKTESDDDSCHASPYPAGEEEEEGLGKKADV